VAGGLVGALSASLAGAKVFPEISSSVKEHGLPGGSADRGGGFDIPSMGQDKQSRAATAAGPLFRLLNPADDLD